MESDRTSNDIYVYCARFHYKPNKKEESEGIISMECNDILHVTTPYPHEIIGSLREPKGWLIGRNVTQGTSGTFPGNFVEYISHGPEQELINGIPPSPLQQGDRDMADDSGYVGTPKHPKPKPAVGYKLYKTSQPPAFSKN